MNNDLEIIKKFPNLFIWHYFNDLRTQIDIAYLKLLTNCFDKKSKIIKTWTNLINKLNELESEYSNKKHNKCSLNNKTILFNEIEDSLIIIKNEWIDLFKIDEQILTNELIKINYIKYEKLKTNKNKQVEIKLNYKKIKSFNFSDKLLEQIDKCAFKDFKFLKILNISNNFIKSIDANLFDDLHHLNSLNLSNNKLVNIPINTFNGLTRLNLLDLSFNQLKSFEINNNNSGLMKLKCLYLNNNQLTSIKINQNLTNLESLYLDDNYIEIYCFNGLFKLKWLTMQNNQIRSINLDSFQDLNSLEYLDLSFNFITYLEKNLFINNLSNLKKIRI